MSAEQTPDIALCDEERLSLAPFAEDAMIFSVGASTERLMYLRSDGPSEWAAEFVMARFAVEVQAIVAARLAAAVREARAAELREAVDALGHLWQNDPIPSASAVYAALRDRANRITEPHEAATSGKEGSKA